MSLTWRDAAATLVAGAYTLVYVLYLQGTDAPIIDSTRGAAATILILGAFGGCALSSPDVYQRDRTVAQRFYIMLAILLGVAALAGALVALVGDAAAGVGVLYYATIALWFIATLRHIVSAPLPPPLTRDTHEVIDPHRTTRS
ncbi:hypothetical protein J5X84_43720 [Streptosporangiaceae bacterium NEAU-GS5]|nr:hypothetical protein [Streptosporangiaceae bacterium NEAU-GS5]